MPADWPQSVNVTSVGATTNGGGATVPSAFVTVTVVDAPFASTIAIVDAVLHCPVAVTWKRPPLDVTTVG